MSALSLEEVLAAARQTFPELAPGSFDLKYRDDEDDLCLLCSSTSPDFVALYQGNSSVRLEVTKKTSQSATPAENTQQQSIPKQTNDVGPPPCTQPSFAKIAEALLGNMHNSGAAHPGMPPFAQVLQQLLGQAAAHPGPASSHGQCGMPPFAQFLPQLLSGNADGLAPLFVQLAPMLLQHLSSVPGALEKHAARKPEIARAALQAVLDALEPFPQLREVLSAVERTLQSENMEGLTQVVIAFLEAFTKLPQEQQLDIAPIVLGSVIEKVLPVVTAAMEEHMAGMQQPQHQHNANVHYGVVCDGCDVSPIVGNRYKCMQRPDYDLCETCHARKGETHDQEHTFRCIAQPYQADCGAGSGFRRSCPWGKGFGKGFGKGWGKGWGKEGGWRRPHCWSKGWGKGDGSSSESDSMSDSSSGPAQSGQEMQLQHQQQQQQQECPETPKKRHARKEAKRAMQEAKRSCKVAVREAKMRYKAEKKVAKHLFKEAKKASKDAFKQAKAARNAARTSSSEPHEAGGELAVPEAMETMDTDAPLLTFPVVVADGRRLEISWRKGDDLNTVATSFTAQHGIEGDEIPTVLHFLKHAEQHAAAVEQHAAAVAPSAPVASAEQHAVAVAAAADQHAAAVAAAAEQHAAAVAASSPVLATAEDTPTAQDAPMYAFNDDGQLQALQAMGFTNDELNMQLLAAYQGNLEQVLEKLL